ncbi:hypothetical protein BS47DRAFT_242333 [Hydnum rufescens UP504]|uniref:Uncharacterized protein n=1 Tax=Hydnum rufescens UP504 TaxID=1448309 RepID=A0A9P6ANY4_9AGAM|nr:hypothetical protein BS47DRAFT_242333 [Hydnum rufescens UP504]
MSSKAQRTVERVVFFALVLDLLAFTIPLPLFPRIIKWYTGRESATPHGFLPRTLSAVGYLRGQFRSDLDEDVKRRWDVVLLGGLLGSLFSSVTFS